jgi:hypothetical protein
MIKWASLACVVVAAFVAGSCQKPPEEAPPAETAPAAEAEPAAFDMAGTYAGGGTDGDGRSYACELDVVEFRTAMYDVKRRVDGGEPIAGVAILNGNTFAVGFNDGRRYGVVAYDVKADGSLAGISAYEGGTRTGTETLTRKRPAP